MTKLEWFSCLSDIFLPTVCGEGRYLCRQESIAALWEPSVVDSSAGHATESGPESISSSFVGHAEACTVPHDSNFTVPADLVRPTSHSFTVPFQDHSSLLSSSCLGSCATTPLTADTSASVSGAEHSERGFDLPTTSRAASLTSRTFVNFANVNVMQAAADVTVDNADVDCESPSDSVSSYNLSAMATVDGDAVLESRDRSTAFAVVVGTRSSSVDDASLLTRRDDVARSAGGELAWDFGSTTAPFDDANLEGCCNVNRKPDDGRFETVADESDSDGYQFAEAREQFLASPLGLPRSPTASYDARDVQLPHSEHDGRFETVADESDGDGYKFAQSREQFLASPLGLPHSPTASYDVRDVQQPHREHDGRFETVADESDGDGYKFAEAREQFLASPLGLPRSPTASYDARDVQLPHSEHDGRFETVADESDGDGYKFAQSREQFLASPLGLPHSPTASYDVRDVQQPHREHDGRFETVADESDGDGYKFAQSREQFLASPLGLPRSPTASYDVRDVQQPHREHDGRFETVADETDSDGYKFAEARERFLASPLGLPRSPTASYDVRDVQQPHREHDGRFETVADETDSDGYKFAEARERFLAIPLGLPRLPTASYDVRDVQQPHREHDERFETVADESDGDDYKFAQSREQFLAIPLGLPRLPTASYDVRDVQQPHREHDGRFETVADETDSDGYEFAQSREQFLAIPLGLPRSPTAFYDVRDVRSPTASS
jgi:hypothetical protein